MWELRDETTYKVIFTGSEEACLKYSIEHPEATFLMVKK